MTRPPQLSLRTLNRALLDRQWLARRAPVTPAEAVEHLVGLQTQVPTNHYTALFSRLADFDAADFSRRFEARAFVRISLLRATIHTVTARDCLRLRPVLEAAHQRPFGSSFGKRLTGVDLAEVSEASRALLDERPLTAEELGRRLAERWPAYAPRDLAMVARHFLALVQVPPHGLWHRGGAARHTTAQSWLGAELAEDGSVDELVLRYLAAFGPASVRDAQTWSGLTRLAEVFERLDGRLRTYRGPDGRTTLFDLAEATLPDEDAPAPPRFLPEFDNAFIGHHDRTRVLPDEARAAVWRGGMRSDPPFLVDGFVRGTWRIDADRRHTEATLVLRPLKPLTADERAGVTAEGAALLAFHTPGARQDVRIEEGADRV
ncbi:winged helix DNA-binding domain-containing protein [Streptomyces sp. 3MP-14]|uniref:Winged helix DNA-binding domain-containing protein n=1 Tax=Streptomyces mimosae TaxID=2586635 RepID=A0A5N6AIE7_9ACTN|nr:MULTISPECIES: winged helix DNA-binding domain-containing protein [Streptomyces]KAB8167786.1 winged helix DNA-binding domain-containing protein [Streptomyces mimosae]KAB8177566.1 winged helix DNA-binding domain-containing protein [Streptomyces sp. 3MP-14]